ncbi:MAG TPA: squalene/phytoene synthase family protein, partial [Paracoccaceae bacterium]|nr:squalene/phytoene synthase family protein [Paracoccaceae bacterium]
MSFDQCAELVAKGDPDRFLAAMTAPVDMRGRLMALYAFNLEVARAPWSAREPMIGRMRLQFWEDAVEEIFAGQPRRGHPVIEAVAEAVGAAALPKAPFAALVEARLADLEPGPPADMAAFESYVAATSAGLMALAARALGAPADEAAQGIGQAMGVANLLRALPELAVRGRLPLPGMAGVDRAELAEGRTTERLAAIIAEIAAGIPAGEALVETEPDRRTAIRRAIDAAGEGDLVVIAGKGHE